MLSAKAKVTVKATAKVTAKVTAKANAKANAKAKAKANAAMQNVKNLKLLSDPARDDSFARVEGRNSPVASSLPLQWPFYTLTTIKRSLNTMNGRNSYNDVEAAIVTTQL